MKNLSLQDDWKVLMSFLPEGWERQAEELGALTRKRKIDSAESLLRVLLIHLADGKSLRSTAAYAKQAGICEVNDVSLLHRLRSSSKWLRWLSIGLLEKMQVKVAEIPFRYRMRVVDGTIINEPGNTGSDWRIHYSFFLDDLKCDNFLITDVKKGETLKRYEIKEDDIILGDRCYCNTPGIVHVLKNEGDVILRFHSTALPLFNRGSNRFDLLKRLSKLNEREIGDWNVWIKNPENNKFIKGRICAIKKNKESIEKTRKKLIQTASKKGRQIRCGTLKFAEYVIIFTTLSRHLFKSKKILSLYRGRWQIELVFKRLKGILRLGHLPKKDETSCIAWLHGKMLITLLTERLYQEAEFFSPWGFPLSIAFCGEERKEGEGNSKYLA